MKDRDTQLAFIKARSEGKSYSTITKELGIAKATCTSWEKTFKEEIATMKREQLEELYTAYSMKREARIKQLGCILQAIDTAISKKPLDMLPAEKLLDLRLKYARELKAEYEEPAEVETDNTLDGLLEQYNQLYLDSKAGKYSPADIKAQLSILDAKKDIIYSLAEEQRKEENILDLDFSATYNSKLIRHADGQN